MQSKPLLIALAAFAVTATGVSANETTARIFHKANLTEDQKQALIIAHELKKEGEIGKARDLLMEAGFDERAFKAISRANKEVKEEIRQAIEANDFESFKEASEGTKLGKRITSEEDFTKLVEIHNLKLSGEFEEARAIINELDLEPKGHAKGHFKGLSK